MKVLIRYRLLDNLKSLAVMLGVLLALPVVLTIVIGDQRDSQLSSFFLVSIVWALVIGIVCTRVDMRMGNQMGLNHRSTFFGSLLGNAAAFAAAAVLTTVVTAVLQLLTQNGDGLRVVDAYQMIYRRSEYVLTLEGYGEMAALSLAACLSAGAFGVLATLAFWRLNRVGKWMLGVGGGLFLGVGLPFLINHMYEPFLQLMAVLTGSVWAMIAFFLCWTVLFLVGAWLLARRAPILGAAR